MAAYSPKAPALPVSAASKDVELLCVLGKRALQGRSRMVLKGVACLQPIAQCVTAFRGAEVWRDHSSMGLGLGARTV